MWVSISKYTLIFLAHGETYHYDFYCCDSGERSTGGQKGCRPVKLDGYVEPQQKDTKAGSSIDPAFSLFSLWISCQFFIDNFFIMFYTKTS